MPSQQTYHKYSFRDSEESFQVDSNCEIAALVLKSMTAVLPSDWQNHFKKLLHVKSPELPEMFLCGSASVFAVRRDLNFKIAALASDGTTACHISSSMDPEEVLLLFLQI